jgi:hypothetical protein
MALLIASLMTSAPTEPTLGVGFARRRENAVIDWGGRKGVAAVNPMAETPRKTVPRL